MWSSTRISSRTFTIYNIYNDLINCLYTCNGILFAKWYNCKRYYLLMVLLCYLLMLLYYLLMGLLCYLLMVLYYLLMGLLCYLLMVLYYLLMVLLCYLLMVLYYLLMGLLCTYRHLIFNNSTYQQTQIWKYWIAGFDKKSVFKCWTNIFF